MSDNLGAYYTPEDGADFAAGSASFLHGLVNPPYATGNSYPLRIVDAGPAVPLICADDFPLAFPRPVKIVLPGERPPSWNDSYAGQHWTKRQTVIQRVRMAVRAAIDPETVDPFTVPVRVTVTVFFASKPQDADNIPAKLYIDALKGWLLADDDRRYVRSVTTVTEVDASRPRVVIEIEPAE